jgi:hypothetical protein
MLLLGCAYEECWPVMLIPLLFVAGGAAYHLVRLLLRRRHRRHR